MKRLRESAKEKISELAPFIFMGIGFYVLSDVITKKVTELPGEAASWVYDASSKLLKLDPESGKKRMMQEMKAFELGTMTTERYDRHQQRFITETSKMGFNNGRFRVIDPQSHLSLFVTDAKHESKPFILKMQCHYGEVNVILNKECVEIAEILLQFQNAIDALSPDNKMSLFMGGKPVNMTEFYFYFNTYNLNNLTWDYVFPLSEVQTQPRKLTDQEIDRMIKLRATFIAQGESRHLIESRDIVPKEFKSHDGTLVHYAAAIAAVAPLAIFTLHALTSPETAITGMTLFKDGVSEGFLKWGISMFWTAVAAFSSYKFWNSIEYEVTKLEHERTMLLSTGQDLNPAQKEDLEEMKDLLSSRAQKEGDPAG